MYKKDPLYIHEELLPQSFIDNLQKRFESHINVKTLLDNTIIAGGYILNLYKKRTTGVGCGYDDIDIFINNRESLQLILYGFKNASEYILKYYGYWENNNDLSIVNIHTINSHRPFQIIYTECENIYELLDHFDTDYCQFGITGNKFCYTEQARVAVETNTLQRYKYFSTKRVVKATHKGFKINTDITYLLTVPYYKKDPPTHRDNRIEYNLNFIDEMVKLKKRHNEPWYNFSDITIHGLYMMGDMRPLSEMENYSWRYIYNRQDSPIVRSSDYFSEAKYISHFGFIFSIYNETKIKKSGATIITIQARIEGDKVIPIGLEHINFDRINYSLIDNFKDGDIIKCNASIDILIYDIYSMDEIRHEFVLTLTNYHKKDYDVLNFLHINDIITVDIKNTYAELQEEGRKRYFSDEPAIPYQPTITIDDTFQLLTRNKKKSARK